MRMQRILLALGLVAVMSAQGVCASPSYNLIVGQGRHDCEHLVAALKRSRLTAMSNQQICMALNSPIQDSLPSPYIRDLVWKPYPVPSDTDRIELARRIQKASLGPKSVAPIIRGTNAVGIAHYLANGFAWINANAGVVAKQATLHIEGSTLYAVAMDQTSCNYDVTKHATLPIEGMFINSKHKVGVPIYMGSLSGPLFYLDGQLVTLYLGPPYWTSHFGGARIKNQLNVFIIKYSKGYNPSGRLGLLWGQVCSVTVRK